MLGGDGPRRPVGRSDIVKVAAGLSLEFRCEATVGDSGKDADWDALESIYN